MNNESTYFGTLNAMLKNYKRAIPCLLIDLDRLDQNIATLKQQLKPDINFRLVTKSLPSPELIEYVLTKLEVKDLMVFHQPFLSDLSQRCDDETDILLGKPMPVKTAAYFYQSFEKSTRGFDPFKQIQWLADTPKRVEEYIELAQKLGGKLRLNLEINVGLHRGGIDSLVDLSRALQLLKDNSSHVVFNGLMGYDPHVIKVPKVIRSQKKALQLANDFYWECKQLIQQEFPELWNENLIFNGAGSQTIILHDDTSPLNELAAGSFLVKPTNFDVPTLSDYLPASFIATPVLKKMKNTTLPGMENFLKMWNFINKVHRLTFFTYGGFWKADYCYPEGIRQNPHFKSTNQTMINASAETALEVDDFVFLRPHQSEFVFLHFGNILAVRGGEIVKEWSLLNGV